LALRLIPLFLRCPQRELRCCNLRLAHPLSTRQRVAKLRDLDVALLLRRHRHQFVLR